MEHLSQVGGMFAILVFLHFVADFIFQKQEEAIKKSTCWKTRFWHCVDYMFPFFVLFVWKDVGWKVSYLCAGILFVSHFIIDTYWFTYLWAQSFRQIPSIHNASTKEEAYEAFKNEFKNPVNAILFITIDQLQHITFLIPVAWLMTR